MSIRWMGAAWRTDCASPSEKLTLLALADHADEAGLCWPSIRTLAQRVGVTEKQARRLTHSLQERGLLVVVGNAQGGRGLSCRYRLTLPNPPTSGSLSGVRDEPETLPPVSQNPPTHVPKPSHPWEGKHQEPSENHQQEKTRAKPAASAPSCPQDVPEQIWTDWLHLLRAKRTPATSTAIAAARTEADNAGMQFADYLAQWCLLGWTPKLSTNRERNPKPEPAWRTEQRNRVLQAVPGIAARSTAGAGFIIEADLCTGSPTRADLPFDPAA